MYLRLERKSLVKNREKIENFETPNDITKQNSKRGF